MDIEQYREMEKPVVDLLDAVRGGQDFRLVAAHLSLVVRRFADCYQPAPENAGVASILDFLGAQIQTQVNMDLNYQELVRTKGATTPQKFPVEAAPL